MHANKETLQHILTCLLDTAQECWDQQKLVFCTWCQKQHTAPHLLDYLIQRVNAWCHNQPLPATQDPQLWEAALAQDAIGWYNLFMGLPTPKWVEVQDPYYTNLGSCHTGTTWLCQASIHLIHWSWQLWEHWNQICHGPNNPQEQAAIADLHQAITQEYQLGSAALPTNI
jgi:hypothetical protein